MAKKFQPRMATANDLLEGDVVYLSSTGDWSRDIRDAALAVNPEAAEALLKRAEGFPNQVVGPYLVEAETRRLRARRARAFPRGVPHPRPLELPRSRPSGGAFRCIPTTISTATYVRARVAQFRDQVERRLDGSLTEDEFRPLRLMNGLYLQLHAYMLRVAIPTAR